MNAGGAMASVQSGPVLRRSDAGVAFWGWFSSGIFGTDWLPRPAGGAGNQHVKASVSIGAKIGKSISRVKIYEPGITERLLAVLPNS